MSASAWPLPCGGRDWAAVHWAGWEGGQTANGAMVLGWVRMEMQCKNFEGAVVAWFGRRGVVVQVGRG